ncbi:Iron only hydrogenase large subunit domain protein [Theileria parva strain Muguga]|uniref:Fe-hydrogenase, putative n=1 Tax=Theileria parva TaxID=5875 RepID=Q4N0Y8_THEPA|nr:Iron only hydrogenase large subunit domain protein [Theileria parva strain Muguga]EAN30899.1 Iron only hydrogenase large subunit domain protein [Theileria parva strain Muguga]|eukprot:XP_763182.1 Fe-hydrogenase [Theileria parva strain Muguga]
MYSNAVKISGLNDYLNPGEECVLPLLKSDNKYEIRLNDKISDSNTQNKSNLPNDLLNNDIYKDNKLNVTTVDKNKKITVGLSDCLSCSGCLTSSEEILLKDENHLKVIEKMKNSDFCVISISPQTIFMLSSHYNMKAEKALRKLSYLFRFLGAKLIFDIGLAELLALTQSKEEFIYKYNNNTVSSTHSSDLDDTNRMVNGINKDLNNQNYKERRFNLPIITSHCPGWTLYAEKTLDQDLLNLISKVPSSQVIQGLLVKILSHTINYYNTIYHINYLKLFSSNCFLNSFLTNVNCNSNSENNIINNFKVTNNTKVYHISIVPCYDKKFETIRKEFQFDIKSLFSLYQSDSNPNTSGDPDDSQALETEPLVDDILSTSDIENILNSLGLKFTQLKEEPPDHLVNFLYYFNKINSIADLNINHNLTLPNYESRDFNHLMKLIRCSGLYSQSGGFAEEIFKHSCKQLFNVDVDNSNLKFMETINNDFKECTLLDSNNNVLLRFIIAYGFRNIQNIIKLLKSRKNTGDSSGNYYQNKSDSSGSSNGSDFVCDYIELMSCPGGCFNGAGQALQSPQSNPDSKKSILLNILPFFPDCVRKKYFKNLNLLKTQVDNQTTSASAFEGFLSETEYISTQDQVCQYFSNLLKLVQSRFDFNLNLSSQKNTMNLKW